jgi:hypothetical protein
MTIHTESRPPPSKMPKAASVRALIVVEGRNDIEFLRRVSRLLHRHDRMLPDLDAMEQRGTLIFLPLGGGGITAAAQRLAPLGLPEWHLYDRELPPETETRRAAVEEINQRHGCCAALTRKRALENYLHPQAIEQAGGGRVEFGDFDSPPDLLARANYQQFGPSLSWDRLPYRARKRLANRAKRWLNRSVVDCMTPELLGQRDRAGEVLSWLHTIGRLAGAE